MMLNKLQFHLSKQNVLFEKDKLILAVSGGVDSMVMLHLFSMLPFKSVVAHCNFQLRGEDSDADEVFVKTIAEEYALPFYSVQFDTQTYAAQNKLSIQLAARELRYHWFRKLKKEINAKWIITAHHTDDQVETFFINLIRGSGIKGLSGIPEINEEIYRPMLFFTRKDILLYAKEHKIAYREDASNAESKYLRNKIRLELIPAMRELTGPELLPIRKSISYLNQTNLFYQDMIQEFIDRFTLQKDSHHHFLDKHQLLQSKHCNQIMTEFLVSKSFSSSLIASILESLASTESKIFYSGEYKFLIERDKVCLMQYSPDFDEELQLRISDGLIIQHPLNLEFSFLDRDEHYSLSKDPHCIHLDADLIADEVFLRKWRQGDRFMPLGMQNEKKISDFFIDSKFDSLKKSSIYLMTSNQEIVWVIGERLDERFKVTSQTVKVLQIRLKSLD